MSQGRRGVHDMGGLPAGPVERSEHDYALWEKRVDALLVLLSDQKRKLFEEVMRRGGKPQDGGGPSTEPGAGEQGAAGEPANGENPTGGAQQGNPWASAGPGNPWDDGGAPAISIRPGETYDVPEITLR